MALKPLHRILWHTLISLGLGALFIYFFQNHLDHNSVTGPQGWHVLWWLVTIAFMISLYGLIEDFIYTPLRQYLAIETPRFIKHLVHVMLGFFVLYVIVVLSLGQSLTSLLAFGGLVGAGVAVSFKNVISDFCAGLVMDVQRPYDVGDWIQLDNEKRGMVIKVGWQQTVLRTLDNTLIVIPNHKVSETVLENFNHQTPYYWEEVKITLNHSVPVPRALAILEAALRSVPGVPQDAFQVYSENANAGGVIYTLRYGLRNPAERRNCVSLVMQHVIEALQTQGLRLSETLGTYGLQRYDNELHLASPLPAERVLQHCPLFQEVPIDLWENLIAQVSVRSVHAGETLLTATQENTHLWVVAEGAAALEIQVTGSESTTFHRVRTFGYGDFFGMSFILAQPVEIPYRIVALTSMRLLAVPQALFGVLMQQAPALQEHMAQELTQALQSMEHLRATVTQESLDSSLLARVRQALQGLRST